MATGPSNSNNPYLQGLLDISQAITAHGYLDDILGLIVRVTAKVAGMEICSLWLVDENDTPAKIHLKATQATNTDYFQDRALDIHEGVVGYVLREKRMLVIPDVLKEPRFKEKEMARKLGLVAMAGVPLMVRDKKAIGVLNCFTTRSHKFSTDELNWITTVANQAAMAILNTELSLTTQLMKEELETRKVIERAKDILVRRRKLTGEQAYQWLRKRSMDSRKPMRDVAEAILLSEDLGYYSSIPHALKR